MFTKIKRLQTVGTHLKQCDHLFDVSPFIYRQLQCINFSTFFKIQLLTANLINKFVCKLEVQLDCY